MLEVRKIIGFPLILKTEHNLSLLKVSIQSLKKLTVVSGPLLFLMYINIPHYSIKFCNVHHFADDTNLISVNSSIKVINKQVNKDLKALSNRLNAKKYVSMLAKLSLSYLDLQKNNWTLS